MADATINVPVAKALLPQVMEATGVQNEQEAVEAALRAFIQRNAAMRLAGIGGKYEFHEGFLEEELAGRI